MARNKFSVIIPTYTGEDNIEECLDSVLAQSGIGKLRFEVIIVIDGPNKKLETIIDNHKSKFNNRSVTYRVFKFSQNKGRFAARLKGAEEAESKQLLFLDDRNILATNYFEVILKANKEALIPNVLEVAHPHFIARVIFLLRKKAYGGKWGKDFVSYYITLDNFEKSSKGTTSFWVNKEIFIDICQAFSQQYSSLKLINEDTKILRKIIERGTLIYRSSEAKIYYQPRQSVIEELKHIYYRGPRFIDYYFKNGTRFFKPLLIAGISPFLVVAILLLELNVLLIMLSVAVVGLLVVSLYIKENVKDIGIILVGLPLLSLSFYAGIIMGFLLFINHKYIEKCLGLNRSKRDESED